jgi:hypothetical protein
MGLDSLKSSPLYMFINVLRAYFSFVEPISFKLYQIIRNGIPKVYFSLFLFDRQACDFEPVGTWLFMVWLCEEKMES